MSYLCLTAAEAMSGILRIFNMLWLVVVFRIIPIYTCIYFKLIIFYIVIWNYYHFVLVLLILMVATKEFHLRFLFKNINTIRLLYTDICLYIKVQCCALSHSDSNRCHKAHHKNHWTRYDCKRGLIWFEVLLNCNKNGSRATINLKYSCTP